MQIAHKKEVKAHFATVQYFISVLWVCVQTFYERGLLSVELLFNVDGAMKQSFSCSTSLLLSNLDFFCVQY